MQKLSEVEALLAEQGLVVRREHPKLSTTLDRLLRTGKLTTVLPGVYVDAGAVHDLRLRASALTRWAPDAVVTGRPAARLTFWPGLRGDEVECALRSQVRAPGFRFVRRDVPADLVVERGGVRLTCPALTALDLARDGPDAIDEVLRTRAATLAQLWQAFELTRNRRGNRQRLVHLLDSRDEPWSAAERLCHRLLRERGVGGWRANHPVLVEGRLYYLDVAFLPLRLGVEIDGRLHEDLEDLFESDRQRQNALVLEGWTVLRFTWRMLTEQGDEVVTAIERARRGPSLRSRRPS